MARARRTAAIVSASAIAVRGAIRGAIRGAHGAIVLRETERDRPEGKGTPPPANDDRGDRVTRGAGRPLRRDDAAREALDERLHGPALVGQHEAVDLDEPGAAEEVDADDDLG